MSERSMDEIWVTALEIYNAQDTAVLDYAADPDLRGAG
jgi:hypothetical protein